MGMLGFYFLYFIMLEIIILISGIINLILGLVVLFGSEQKRGRVAFAFFSAMTFLWALCNFFLYSSDFPIFVRLAYSAGALVLTSIIFGVLIFTSRSKVKKYKSISVFAIGIIIAVLPLATDLVVNNIKKNIERGFDQDTGVLFSVYVIFFLFSYFFVIFKLGRYLRQSSGQERSQTRLILLGFSLYVGCSILLSFILPLFNYLKLTDFDVPSSLIFVAFTTYAIVQYRWMNIKVIAFEFLAVLIMGASLFEVFIAEDLYQRIYKTALFLILSTLSFFMIRSVLNEIKRKDELQEMSNQLAVANSKLRQLDKAKSEFISIASHQLRTPLTSIKGFGSLLLEGTYGPLPDTQRNALEKIYISNERLIQLVEDLLNISRMEAGRMEFDFQEAQIEDLVQEAADTLELSAKAKKLYLHWQKPSVALPKLKIDITKIKEVISNMVDNAIKYTQKGGVTVRAERGSFFDHETREQKNVIRVSVSDTGIGMDKDELENIFNKFERGKDVSHYHTDGTGLGMYVGKKMVEAHHGKIWAESPGKGKGSRFVLELPVG